MRPKEEKKETQTEPEKKKKVISLATEQLNAYEGNYWSDELGVGYRLRIAEGKLKVAALMDSAGTLRTGNLPLKSFVATGNNEFEMEDASIALHFQRNASQTVEGFSLDAGQTRGMIFTRRDTDGM